MTTQHTDEMPKFELMPVSVEAMDRFWDNEFYGIPTYICLDDKRVWPHPKQIATASAEAKYLPVIEKAADFMEKALKYMPYSEADDEYVKEAADWGDSSAALVFYGRIILVLAAPLLKGDGK